MNKIIKNLNFVKEEIKKACQKVGRDPGEVLILLATKGRTPEEIKVALKEGRFILGENRAQELKEKLTYLPQDLRIDFIGHLQTNKVKLVVKFCHLIHSVDSFQLAETIDREARKVGKIQKILLEVNIVGEETKFGFNEETLINMVPKILKLKNVKLLGLMTMAPEFPGKEKTRPVFKKLKDLKENLERKFKISLLELSMGMSNDYQVAIEEGATIIRLGRALFN